jgi:alcohol dehydrogenase (cytochrome c)
MRKLIFFASATLVTTAGLGLLATAQVVRNYKPVTNDMLLNPPAEDWLMFSRTYDAQRFSPLKQINKQNVGQLRTAWVRGLGPGVSESIPIVHDGVMYIIAPGGVVQAVNAATGDLIWEYRRKVSAPTANSARSKTLSIVDDIVVFLAPDSTVVGLDATTGEQRWETKTEEAGNTSGSIVINGMVISGRACGRMRQNCFVAAHDAKTGKEIWRFYTTPAPGEPGDESWNGADLEKRLASPWGLPGTYDPVRKTLYWGIANPMPNTRMDRHNGNADGTSRTSPSDLYSNSTVALDPATGKLQWYYQHLPGDDWDEDYTHERTLLRTRVSPNPKSVKWINPDIPRGQERDIAVMVGEGGGVFALDRNDGKFLWATPFPFDTPEFLISNIDGKTGKTTINWDVVLKKPGDRHLVCYWNTRSHWPTAYHPGTNSLYVPYVDNCLDMTAAAPGAPEHRVGAFRPGSDPNKIAGLVKINLETGDMTYFGQGRYPSNGAVLATAGDLIFHGDFNRRFRAYDAATGKQLWESILGGPIAVSTITYAVNGKQYIAVQTGDSQNGIPLAGQVADLKYIRGHNAMYVFALP